MENQIVDFVVRYPIVLIPLMFMGVYFRYRRFKRKAGDLRDQRSRTLLILGGAVTLMIIIYWLWNS